VYFYIKVIKISEIATEFAIDYASRVLIKF